MTAFADLLSIKRRAGSPKSTMRYAYMAPCRTCPLQRQLATISAAGMALGWGAAGIC